MPNDASAAAIRRHAHETPARPGPLQAQPRQPDNKRDPLNGQPRKAEASNKTAIVRLPLPGPGNHYAELQAPGVPHPWVAAPLRPAGSGAPLSANTFLADRAVRVFEGKVRGTETVAVRGGTLVMFDKFGSMWEAEMAEAAPARARNSSGGGGGGGSATNSSSSGIVQNGTAAEAPPPPPPPPPPPRRRWRFKLSPEPVASLKSNAGGRPLGFHPDERTSEVYVCDSRRGLVVVEAAKPAAAAAAAAATNGGGGGGGGKGQQREVRDVATTIAPHSRVRGGQKITYANDLALAYRRGAAAVAADETVVYFTSSTDIEPPYDSARGFYDTMRGYELDLAQGAPRGALLAWSPSLGGAVVVAEGFYYANGVALSRGGDYALVVETNYNRVLRVWLDGRPGGDRAGGGGAAASAFKEARNSGPGGPGATLAQGFRAAPRVDIFARNFPGMPDGISRALPSAPPAPPAAARAEGGGNAQAAAGDAQAAPAAAAAAVEGEGNKPQEAGAGGAGGEGEEAAFWVALIGRVPDTSRLVSASARAAYAWLPAGVRPSLEPWGGALRLRASDGKPEALLLDPAGERVSSVSSVTESPDGLLFFGNLEGDSVSYVDLRPAGRPIDYSRLPGSSKRAAAASGPSRAGQQQPAPSRRGGQASGRGGGGDGRGAGGDGGAAGAAPRANATAAAVKADPPSPSPSPLPSPSPPPSPPPPSPLASPGPSRRRSRTSSSSSGSSGSSTGGGGGQSGGQASERSSPSRRSGGGGGPSGGQTKAGERAASAGRAAKGKKARQEDDEDE